MACELLPSCTQSAVQWLGETPRVHLDAPASLAGAGDKHKDDRDGGAQGGEDVGESLIVGETTRGAASFLDRHLSYFVSLAAGPPPPRRRKSNGATNDDALCGAAQRWKTGAACGVGQRSSASQPRASLIVCTSIEATTEAISAARCSSRVKLRVPPSERGGNTCVIGRCMHGNTGPDRIVTTANASVRAERLTLASEGEPGEGRQLS